MKYIERFAVAAAVVLGIGTLALGTAQPPRTPEAAARLRPEQIATMPARIQAQLAGPAWITASQQQPAAASVRRLRPEQVMTLPPQIQAQVAGTAVQPAQALAPEDIVALPPQIQEQVRRSLGLAATPPAEGLRPEWIVTLPPQIQDQVRGTPKAATR